MGNVPLKAETSKHVDEVAGNGLTCVAASMQGWRLEMEVRRPHVPTPQDAHVAVTSLPGHANVSLFAVFDGHGGDRASLARCVARIDSCASSQR